MKKIILILILIGVGYGYYYYTTHKQNVDAVIQNVNDTKNAIVDTTTASIDMTIKNAVAGVDKVSPVYYYNNRSYGASSTSNICLDTSSSASIGSIIAFVQKYTKAISCTVDPVFPSKSFTLTAPSLTNKGQYYCTDQSGFVGLIPDINLSSNFKIGLSCK